MLSSVLAMAGFALAGAITPGPVNVLALRHGNGRAVAAFCYVLGASLSYALIVWLMGQSGQWLLKQPELLRWAPRVCALYLLWLAWQLARAPGAHGQAARQSAPASLPAGPGGAFVQGIAIQSLNPKAWLVALSGIGMFVAPLAAQQVSLPSALLLFCTVSLLACLLGVGCWAVLGHALTRWLNTPLRRQRLNQALAMVLVASVLSMLA
ncbi:lysine transporter LysE [Comamonas testosteroni]|uniref:Lysine transporter LysE n=1 Tax=Comamonas testosteroni TaxID=285 RepID=A0A0L7N9Y7_COMTE|nr:LysE family transporter [Comamonas testosteroni]KOC30693.1 lysine transporter LysE [Comamonas testosteroni]KWT68411.1 Lysine exporter protein (LYSE/YGGA) [Comamonas testosteroni]